MRNSIEISSKTCALSFKSGKECTIIEGDREIDINMSLQEFMNYNCEYYGSSFEGRIKGSQLALGMKYKLPIIVEESREMIFFPTRAYNNENCSWISLNNIYSYKSQNSSTLVTFTSGKQYKFEISFESFENQVLRASKLLLILKNRKLESTKEEKRS